MKRMSRTQVGTIAWIAALCVAPVSAQNISPEAAIDRLRAGNANFLAGRCTHPNADAARRAETARNGQNPFATILSCSDSRIPPERIFDQGVGDLFIVRVAGNVSDTDEIGTIEYGVGHLGTPLLVVMGHTQCGAVTAVCTQAQVGGCIPHLVDNIGPAATAARTANPTLQGQDLVQAATIANVWQSIADLLKRSPEVREKARAGQVKIIGAMYELESGKVDWLGQHPDWATLINWTGGHEPTHNEKPTPAPTPHNAAHAKRTGGPGPAEAWQVLKEGHQRWASGKSRHPNTDLARVAQTAAHGQQPIATILSCSDSRAPVERIFDQGIGDLFVVRVAGNVCDVDQTGTIEYGVGHLHTPLLIVLGHTGCGAVTAVCNHAHLEGCIPQLIDNVQPAVASVKQQNPKLEGPELVSSAIRANVYQSMYDVLRGSEEVRELVANGQLQIVGGIYNIESGLIEWLGEHPQQKQLIGQRTASGAATDNTALAKHGH